jgi:hypothetical protein
VNSNAERLGVTTRVPTALATAMFDHQYAGTASAFGLVTLMSTTRCRDLGASLKSTW